MTNNYLYYLNEKPGLYDRTTQAKFYLNNKSIDYNLNMISISPYIYNDINLYSQKLSFMLEIYVKYLRPKLHDICSL